MPELRALESSRKPDSCGWERTTPNSGHDLVSSFGRLSPTRQNQASKYNLSHLQHRRDSRLLREMGSLGAHRASISSIIRGQSTSSFLDTVRSCGLAGVLGSGLPRSLERTGVSVSEDYHCADPVDSQRRTWGRPSPESFCTLLIPRQHSEDPLLTFTYSTTLSKSNTTSYL
jgi:hypothetical protein